MLSGSSGLLPIYTATKSLEAIYQFSGKDEEKLSARVEGAAVHAMLHSKVNWLIDFRNAIVDKENLPYYTKSLASLNLATAAVTVLYTDTSTDEGYLGEGVSQKMFYLSGPPIVSSYDFYTEQYKYRQSGLDASRNARDYSFNFLLEERMNAFFGVAHEYDLPKDAITTPADLEKSINGRMFHETFHHSEQAIMHYLSDLDNLLNLAKAIYYGAPRAAHVYGVVLDIFSQRMLCHHCNFSLAGMQRSRENGFLNMLGLILKDFRIESSDLTMGVRVSAERNCRNVSSIDELSLPTDDGVVHVYEKGKTPDILQADIESLGVKKIMAGRKLEVARCPATLFASADFSKNLLEKRLAEEKMLEDVMATTRKKPHIARSPGAAPR